MPEPSMLQVVLMGLITVFIALICLIIIIVILGKIMVAVTGNKTPQTTPAPAPAPAVTAPAPQAGNQQLVAAIAAAFGELTSLKSFDLNREGIHYENLSCQCQRHCL